MAYLKGHWQLILITVIVFALWQTPVVAPLKILVVFLHELAHGAAAVLTGGSIESLTVNAQQGGLAVTRGGSRFVILTAGYLGSLLIGAGLLIVALRTKADRLVLGALGGIMLCVSVLYIREGFALAFCLTTGAVLLGVAWWLPQQVCDMLLRLIGLSSLIYVPYDIFDDTLRRASLRSDARMLAEEIGGTTMLWGGLWLLLSLWVVYLSLRYGLGRKSNIAFARRRA